MKKLFILLIGVVFLFSSCALHNGITTSRTEVVLAKKNFKVIESVKGESEAMYIFRIGGLARKSMIAEARANMLSKANIVGGAKAIINETIETKHSFFPFVRKYKVIVSGHVIEFTE